MAKFAERYTVSTDQNGLAVITVVGRCITTDIASIENNATRRYKMERIPHAAGAVLKPLDGTPGIVTAVSVPAFEGARTYNCVKVDGRVNPYAIRQSGGTYDGQMVHQFQIRYQEVGGVS